MMRKILNLIVLTALAAIITTGCNKYAPHKDAYNPYLEKVKTKPSRQLSKQNAALEKSTVKASKKKMRENKKKLYGK
jgi:hypothetical protein